MQKFHFKLKNFRFNSKKPYFWSLLRISYFCTINLSQS